MTAVAVAVFALTYLLIASRRLRVLPIGRPAGALLGAVLMVALGVLTPEQSYQAIDHDTILLLFAMMLLTAYLEQAGFFEALANLVLERVRSPAGLLALTALAAGVLSAFLVNDTVCLFMTPVLILLCRRGRLPFTPYLMGLCTSANIGSAATLVGNPQNMIIGSMSRIPFNRFFMQAGPAALLGLALNLGLLWLFYRRDLPAARTFRLEPGPPVDLKPLRLPLAVLLGIVAGFFAGLHLGYTTLFGVLVLMVVEGQDPRERLARVDFALLIFFSGLFIVVAGLARTGLILGAFEAMAPHMRLSSALGLGVFSTVMTLGSNLVSNVPMVLMSGPHLGELGGGEAAWVLMAFATTVAGNLTLVGSVANIIVAEGAREHTTLGFWEYLRFGVPSTILVLTVGVAVIHALG